MYFVDVPVETGGTHKGARKQSTLCCSHCVQRDGGRRRDNQKNLATEEVVSDQHFILELHDFSLQVDCTFLIGTSLYKSETFPCLFELFRGSESLEKTKKK